MVNASSEFTRDAVAFMGKYELRVNTGNIVGGPHRFVIETDPSYGPVARLRVALVGDNPTFAGYYLPYAADSTQSVRLGNMGDFMFTQPFTGCSFVIDNQWFSPLVSHLNYQTLQDDIDQARIDQEIIQCHGPANTSWIVANYFTLRKADYVPDGEDSGDNRTIVFGVRGLLGWTVYRVKAPGRPTRIN